MRSNRGISIIVVLAALVIVGLVGTTLLKMSHSDKMGAILYSHSESARLASTSGLIAAVNKLCTSNIVEQTELILNLNEYVNADNPDTIKNDDVLWLMGGPDSWETLSSDQKYRVRIDAIDVNQFTITIVSEGTGHDGSRSTAVGVYSLHGLGWNDGREPLFMDALHLGQGAGEIVSELRVLDGDVFVENPQSYFTGAGGKHVFNGLFRTGIGSSAMKIKNIDFNGPAYFRCPVTLDGDPVWFNQGVGFERLVNPGSKHIHVTGGNGAFLNGGFLGGAEAATCGMEMYGLDIYGWDDKAYTAGMTSTLSGIALSEGTAHLVADSITNVVDQLGITKPEPPRVAIDISKIPAEFIHHSHAVFGSSTIPDGDDLTDAYNTLTKWNGFLVLTGRSTEWSAFGHDGTFDGKVIWIMKNESTLRTPWNGMFEMGANANFLLYLDNTVVGDFRLPMNFRGLVFSDGSATVSPKHIFFGRNNEVHGGIYIKDRIFRLQDDGGSFDVFFDSDVMSELEALEIFYNVDDPDNNSGDKGFVITGERIRSELIGRVL